MNKFFLILAVLMLFNAHAQKFELGKVTIEELSEKSHPLDSTAGAAILFKIGEVRVEEVYNKLISVTTVKTKIKIYNKSGYDWANQFVSYYNGDSYSNERVTFSNVATYNLLEGKIVATKLSKESEFDKKITKEIKQKSIVFPSVKEGSIIEFEYSLSSPYLRTIDSWEFQASIPINYVKYATQISDYFEYKPNIRGFIYPKRTVEKRGSSVRTTYISENVKAMKKEGYVNNLNNYLSSITHELVTVSMPGSQTFHYTSDWESFSKKIYESEYFGTELKKTGYFDDDIDSLLLGLTDPAQKIHAIFNYVRQTMKFDDDYGYYCDKGVRKAYKEKLGNAAEINLMLTSMLRYAGFTANPIILSTRENGISFFPSYRAFNFVIAGVEIKNELILLDATDKFAQPDVLPFRNLNWSGRLIRKDGTSEMVDFIPKRKSIDAVNLMLEINEKKEIKGRLRRQLSDYEALIFRSDTELLTEEKYLEDLENDQQITVENYKITNQKDPTKPLIEAYDFESKDIEVIGNKMYVNPLLFFRLKSNPFQQEKREYPVDFGYTTEEKYLITFVIPEGYAIESVPENIKMFAENELGSFTYIVAKTDKRVQISISKSIDKAIVISDYYEILKTFFGEIVQKENQRIVFVKV